MKSRDRVRFTLPPSELYRGGMADLLKDVFGIDGRDVHLHRDFDKGVTVVCRPSQFARFLILRNDRGIQNSFKALNPVLFVPEPEPPVLDVSGRPNEYRP